MEKTKKTTKTNKEVKEAKTKKATTKTSKKCVSVKETKAKCGRANKKVETKNIVENNCTALVIPNNIIENIVKETQLKYRKQRKQNPIKIYFSDGRIEVYKNYSQATKSLNIPYNNAIGSYWLKGKSLHVMKKFGIEKIERII